MQRHLRLHHTPDPNDASESFGGLRESRDSGRSVVGQLKGWSNNWSSDQAITLLDISIGPVDVPVMVRRWALAAGRNVRVTSVVASRQALELGRERLRAAAQSDSRFGSGIELQQVDALKLTDVYEPQSFDYVHAGAALQELHEIELLTMLRIMDRLASRGIIWTGRAGLTRRQVLNCAKRLDLTYAKYSSGLLSKRFVFAGEKT